MAVHAFIFPGQGSQAVGMGRDLAAAFGAARSVFEEVDEVLKQKLSKLMFEGPSEELTLTENAQPALMAVSLAVLRVLESEGGILLPQKAALVAGHSLGEYSALAAAEAFSVADTALLLKLRGQAMQKAVAPGVGAMAALLSVEMVMAQEICDEAAQGDVVGCANDNGGGQVVISGLKAAVERAIEDKGREAGDAAAGFGAVSLRVDGAGGRGDGGSAEQYSALAAGCAAGGECVRGEGDGPGEHQGFAGEASDRDGALAGERVGDGGDGGG
jgi:malonyl CoA-acyl carrier protein transacylase